MQPPTVPPARAILCTALTLGLALAASASDAAAQCADGTPPPCARATPVRTAAAPVPSAQARARRFIVLPFRNVTRLETQAWLVEGSTTMLAEALSRWQGITVVPDERLYPALKRAGVEPGSIVDRAVTRRLAEETGGWTAVSGEVIASGGRVRIIARAWDVASDRELVRTASEVSLEGDIRVAFDSVGLSLLRAAGIDAGSINLAELTTRNVDAYRAYLRGLAHIRRSEVALALPAFTEAVTADSTFAHAWADLAAARMAVDPSSVGNPMSPAAQAARRAVALSARLPDRRRRLIVATDYIIRFNIPAARIIVDSLLAADQNDVEALELAMGVDAGDFTMVAVGAGQRPRGSPQRQVAIAKRIAELDPSRYRMYGMLSATYADAGSMSPQPRPGFEGEYASLPELMTVARSGRARLFNALYQDSLVLVPAESIPTIPKDSLAAWRASARQVARAWAERWIASAGGESAPFWLLSELQAQDRDFAGALKSLDSAEARGLAQGTAINPRLRRLFFLAQAGETARATGIADSLRSTGVFQNPNSAMLYADALSWTFNLYLLSGNLDAASDVLKAFESFHRSTSGGDDRNLGVTVVQALGSQDPDEEPRIPRAFRRQQLNAMAARVTTDARHPTIGPLLPAMLPGLAGIDSIAGRDLVMDAATRLHAAGDARTAFALALRQVLEDSLAAPAALAQPWFREGVTQYAASLDRRNDGVRAASAVVDSARITVSWQIAAADTIPLNEALSPIGSREFTFEARISTDSRSYWLRTGLPQKWVNSQPEQGNLRWFADRIRNSVIVFGGKPLPNGEMADTTQQIGTRGRVVAAGDSLQLIIEDSATVATIRRSRPRTAEMRFRPCRIVISDEWRRSCSIQTVEITYR